MEIREILARRSDLGTFLVHLTKDGPRRDAKARLTSIVESLTIQARTPFGQAAKKLQDENHNADSQKCVCFTETPLEYLNMLHGRVEGRQVELAPYGIAVTKKQGRAKGVNPVWYLDITPGHTWLTGPVDELIEEALSDDFENHPIAKLAPFIEQMGTSRIGRGYRKEFWWEREWRCKGDFSLPYPFLVVCPEDEIDEFEALIEEHDDVVARRAKIIGANWGLEQIIGRLAGFSRDDIEIL
jgi:hypothetical protein